MRRARAILTAMTRMLSLALCAALTAAPVAAQDDRGELSEGLNLLQEGGRLLLRGLSEEMGLAMEDMSEELRDALNNLSAYHAPEILPNGDILIRRRTPLDPEPEDDLPEIGEDGQIEL
jgi:hypothetical protein